MLKPGDRIDRYELVSRLGEGGMAEVWVARQEGKHGFSKLFALKAIHERFADDPQFHKMFLDEARIASAIEHPNVAQVFDLGDHAGTPYLVMEYVDGDSLAAFLAAISKRTGKPGIVPAAIALRIVADVCAGLHAAHKLTDANGKPRGVVHRDVSPQNILLSAKGDVKLIDFGIAHAADRVGGDTALNALKGKLRYMPPEQAKRQPIGPYSDVFSAGAVLYRMLAGRSPFEADTDLETMQLLVSDAAPASLPPDDVSPLVAAIVSRATELDPGDRYGSALAMQNAIEAAIAEEGYVPDVATWVRQNLPEKYHERRAQLDVRAALPGNIADVAVDKTMPSTYDVKAARGSVPDLMVPPTPVRRAIESAPDDDEADVKLSMAAPHKPKPPKDEIRSFSAAANEPEPASEPEPEPDPRSIMDVKAIAAQRKAEAERPPEPKPKPKPKAEDDGGGDAKGDQNPASARVATKRPPPPKNEPKPKPWAKLGLAAVVVVGVPLLAMLVAPPILKSRIVASARDAGLEIEIDSVNVGFAGITLQGISARAPTVPGVLAKVDQVFIAGVNADTVRVTGIDTKIDGRFDDVSATILRLYDQNKARLAPSTPHARRVSLVGARVHWTGPFGEGSKLDAGDLGLEIESKGPKHQDIRGAIGRFDVTTKRTTLGPWAASFESAAGSSRVRLVFDPPVPDGPSAAYVWGPATATHLTVKIPRTPFAQLGLRAADLGLPADDASELEVKLEGTTTSTGRLEGKGRVDLWGARIKGWKSAVDVKIEGAASGAPGKPLDLERASVHVGPFAASLAGTLTPYDQGVRLDASWKTTPIACEKLARAEAKTLGPFAATIQEIAQTTGAARITGTAFASGLVKLDSRSPEEASITYQAKETCGLSLFGL